MANAPAVARVEVGQRRLRAIQDQVALGLVGLMLFLAVTVYALAPLFAYQWTQRPFLGGFVEQTNIYNGLAPTVAGEWALSSVFPGFGYRITSVNGVPVSADGDLATAIAGKRVGDEVRLGYINENDPAHPSGAVTVRLATFPLRDTFTYFVIPYFIGFCYLLVGLWVFRLRRTEVAGRVFAAFCACMAVTLGALFDVYTTHGLTRLWTAVFPLAGGSLFTLALVLPQEAAFVTRRPILRWIGFAPAVALAFLAELRVYDYAHPTAYAAAWGNSFLFSGVIIPIFVGMAGYRLWRAASPIAREQSRIILIGSAIAFLPVGFWLAANQTIALGLSFNAAIYLPPLIVFPVVVGYAILRYRLLNTDYIISQALVYAALGILVTLGHGLLVAGVSLAVGTAVPANNPILIGLLVLILVLVFNPLRERLQNTVDALFFRSARAHREALQSFSRKLTRALDLEQIASTVKTQITTSLHPTHCHIFLRRPAGLDYAAYASRGRPETDVRFSAEGALAFALAAQSGILYLAPDSPPPATLAGDRARLAVLGSTSFVPLPGKIGLQGWLALGPRLSGEPYTRDDLTFLESIADQAAVAIERAQSVTDIERRLTELNVLGQVSQAVNFTIAFDDLLELIFAQASKVVDTSNFHIILKDPQAGTLSYAFFIENGERLNAAEGRPWPTGQGLASEIIRTGQPILTDDYRLECERRGVRSLGHPYRAWLGVPLNAGAGGTLGVMVVAAHDPGVLFTLDQLKIFWAIADQAATAIEKSRLYRETEQRARQLATLNAVAQSLTSTLELQPLLQRITESAADILAVEAGSLFLFDEATGDFIFTVATGPVAPNLLGTRIPGTAGIVGAAAASGRPLIVNEALNDPRVFKSTDQSTGFVTRALMAAPLRAKERTLGVIEVINRRDGRGFDESDQDLLQAFAGQAAISVENARLYTLTDQALAARVDELSMLQRIDRELNTTLDVSKAIAITLNWAMRATNASAGAAGMVVSGGLLILAAEGYGDALDEYRETPMPLDKGIVGRVIQSGQMTLVRDVRSDPSYAPLRESTFSQLTVPLLREKEIIGLITLESDTPDAFADDRVEFMNRLADHASSAITNARLFAEVRQANLAKSEFVSFVAHELKTPMTSIKGYTDLLAKGVVGPISDGQVQFLNTIRSNVERMASLVTDLADISRIEAGRMRLELAVIPFRAVIDDVARSTAAQYEAKKQTLEQQIADDLPPVWADMVRMAQVLTNLISNAHKYTPEGGHIILRVEPSQNIWDADGAPDVLHISVTDNGIGISPEDQKQIFSKFFRAEDRVVREVPGTGLGLNIFKNLVELQGGKAWFESEVGKGSTFHFTVPLATPEQRAGLRFKAA
ncbi:MAG: GAF domain-containing protein [Chloroflexi bacterium]|nr:GAF domain-containing protein [Chloroflexota bacterium]